MKIIAIYPKVDMFLSEEVLRIGTLLRKEKDGKWFHWTIYHTYEFDGNYSKEKLVKHINLFHLEVYRVIFLGRVNEKVMDLYGDTLFKIDPDQTPEEDRLANLTDYL